MRQPSRSSDVTFKPRRFLIAPDIAPRMLCGCHPVTFPNCSMVAPFLPFNRAITFSSLLTGPATGFGVGLDFASVGAGVCLDDLGRATPEAAGAGVVSAPAVLIATPFDGAVFFNFALLMSSTFTRRPFAGTASSPGWT